MIVGNYVINDSPILGGINKLQVTTCFRPRMSGVSSDVFSDSIQLLQGSRSLKGKYKKS